METKIIIAEISDKNGWYNIKTNEGKEVSVMAAKCPKLTEVLKTAIAGTEVTGKLVEKDGKLYLWDLNEQKSGGSGKSFAPKDKSFEAAIAAAAAASKLWGLNKDVSDEKALATAEKIHTWIMSKATKPTNS